MKDLSPQLAALLSKHGMQTSQRRGIGPTWNGRDLDLHNANNTAWVTHELAHFITSRARLMPNWGLGTDPGGGAESKRTLSGEACTIDEDKALVGGVILLIHLKESDNVIKAHVEEYGIANLGGQVEPIYKTLPTLLKRMVSLKKVNSFSNCNYS